MIHMSQKEYNEQVDEYEFDIDMHIEYQMQVRFNCPACDDQQIVEPQSEYHSFECDNCGLRMGMDVSEGETSSLGLHSDEQVTA